MHPEYIVIVLLRNYQSKIPGGNIVCATFAYSMIEAEIIAKQYYSDTYYVSIVEVDYSMRGE